MGLETFFGFSNNSKEQKLVSAKWNTCTNTVATSDTIAVFTNKEFDPYGIYNPVTGNFTLNRSGLWEFEVVMFASANQTSTAVNKQWSASFYRNGAAQSSFPFLMVYQVTAVSLSPIAATRSTLKCAAGDIISAQHHRDSQVGTSWTVDGSTSSYVMAKWLGYV